MSRHALRPLSLRNALVSLLLAGAAIPAHAGDGTWTKVDPGALMSHSLTFDPARSRAVLFGGFDGEAFLLPAAFHNETWALDLIGAPTWSQLRPTGSPPPARIEHAAVLDPLRDRIVVFGGKTSTVYYNDLWSLSLSGGGSWSPLVAAGIPPAPIETRGVCDPVRDRILFFGGYRPGTGDTDELWELTLSGTPTWNRLFPSTSIPARRAHGLVYDPSGDRLVVFGGFAPAGFRSDVWALDLASLVWTDVTPAGPGPSARFGHGMMYDPARDRAVVSAGYGGAMLALCPEDW